MDRTKYIDTLEAIGKANDLDEVKLMVMAAIAEDAREYAKLVNTVDVILVGRNQFAEQKINAIRTVRELTGYGLKEAKDAVEIFPHLLGRNIPLKKAFQLKGELRACGYTVKFEPETELTEILG